MEGTGANLRLTYNNPFTNSFDAVGTNPSPGSGGIFLQETNGFTAPNGGADSGNFPRIEDPNIKPQATNEYSLTVEYQLNNFSSVKVSSLGELSEHLIQAARPNQPCVIGGTNSQGPYAQNAYNNYAEWGPTAADIRHSVNGTLVYELPFGIGRDMRTTSTASSMERSADGRWR